MYFFRQEFFTRCGNSSINGRSRNCHPGPGIKALRSRRYLRFFRSNRTVASVGTMPAQNNTTGTERSDQGT